MSPRRGPPATLRNVRLWWYAVAAIPIALLIYAPLMGWLPAALIVVGLFLLFFWIFSLGFAIYAKLRAPKDLRQ